MELVLLLLIIGTAIFVGIGSKKFYDKPYIFNFSLAVLMLLLVIQTLRLQPITATGYIALVICSLAFLFQLVLGIKNVKAKGRVKA
jgi:hypothetical protein